MSRALQHGARRQIDANGAVLPRAETVAVTLAIREIY